MEKKENIAHLRNLQATEKFADDKDMDFIFDMLDPVEDRKEMSEIFNKAIGYDPTTYYISKSGHNVVQTAVDIAEAGSHHKTSENLKAAEDSMVENMVDNNTELRDQYSYFGMKSKIRDIAANSGDMSNNELYNFMDSLEEKYNSRYSSKANSLPKFPREEEEEKKPVFVEKDEQRVFDPLSDSLRSFDEDDDDDDSNDFGFTKDKELSKVDDILDTFESFGDSMVDEDADDELDDCEMYSEDDAEFLRKHSSVPGLNN